MSKEFQVEKKPQSEPMTAPSGLLQRRASNEHEPDTVPPIVHEVLRSPGQPLDHETRAFFESRFGHDFSHVRVLTDVEAADSAQIMNAKAYTAGQYIVFGASQYKPETREGQSLLAHELTHVVQQMGQNLFTTTPILQRKQKNLTRIGSDWREIYKDCRNKIFGDRNTLSWGGRRVPPFEAVDLIINIAGTGSGKYGPEDLATVWAIESNFTTHPTNKGKIGNVDIGPAQINYSAHGQGMSNKKALSIFGTNLDIGQTFNGSPYSNLNYGWKYLTSRKDPSDYNPKSSKRPEAIAVLTPELRKLFQCIFISRTITFSEEEAKLD